MFFDILKNACKIGKLHLKTMPKLEVAIALYSLVAWRINRLMRLGRECPELDASLVFEPHEWMAAYILKKKPPKRGYNLSLAPLEHHCTSHICQALEIYSDVLKRWGHVTRQSALAHVSSSKRSPDLVAPPPKEPHSQKETLSLSSSSDPMDYGSLGPAISRWPN